MNGLETSGSRLRLAAREMRVTRNGRSTQKRKQNNPASLAARILHQHDQHRRRWPLITRVLPRPAQPASLQLSTQKHQWQLRTNLSLTLIKNYPVLHSRQGPAAEPPVMQTDPLATLRGHAVMNAQRLNLAAVQGRKVFDGSEGHDSGRLTKKLMTGHKEQLVDRLVERVKRIERVQIQQPTLAKAASRPRESAPVQAPPVPRLFRRQGAAMPNPTPTVPSETVYFPQDYRASNGRRPGKNGDFDTALTNLDVNNLTDQIVRNIDQRVIAYRERRGKI